MTDRLPPTSREPYGPYCFADRKVLAACPLPSLHSATGDATAIDLWIGAPHVVEALPERRQWQHQWPDPRGNATLQLAPDGTRCVLRTPGLCDFHIDATRTRIEVVQTPNVDAETLEHLLVDQVLPRLLADQGALVVHASCLRIGDACALFMGQSGWGKSTLAGLLQQAGHDPLSDDCTVLQLHADGVQAIPTYPSLRLFDDSIAQAFASPPRQSPVAHYTGKRRVHLACATDPHVPAPVAALYLINNPREPAEQVGIVPISPAIACMTLVEHGFRLDLSDRLRGAGFLQQAADIARCIPAFSLAYPRDYAAGQHLVARVAEHCRRQTGRMTHPSPPPPASQDGP